MTSSTVSDPPFCLSGGAEGADLQWGMCAGKAGHIVRHFIFQGHRSKAPAEELVVLTPEQLSVADEYLKQANRTLKRRFPTSNGFTNGLLRRNYYQVFQADAVFAISTIRDGLVQGGTAWAVQMFLDRFQGASCHAYVFDQNADGWFKWEGEWVRIDAPPQPWGVWAGIGSRDLKQNGKDAIRSLLGYVPEGTREAA